MSAATRAALADAANTHLGDKRVTPYYRQSPAAGWGWVTWGRADRDGSGFGYLDVWEIRVVLAQDVAEAEAWIDEHRDALTDALSAEMVVTGLAPAVLTLDTTKVNALIIEGVREH